MKSAAFRKGYFLDFKNCYLTLLCLPPLISAVPEDVGIESSAVATLT